MNDPAQLPLPLEFLHLITASQGKAEHLLDIKETGGFRLRLCVLWEANGRLCGKRIKLSLRSRDKHEASLRRDVVLEGFRAAGLIPFARVKPEPAADADATEEVLLLPGSIAEAIREHWGQSEIPRPDVVNAYLERRRREAEAPPTPAPDPGASIWAGRI